MARSSTTFTKGRSGNSNGRPPGKTSRTRFREMVKTALPAIVKSLVRLAKTGDVQSAKLILDRCVPALKPTADAMTIKTAGTLAKQGQEIVAAMTKGTVAPDAAQVAMNTLVAQSRLVEQSEVIQRIEALEQLICPTAKR